jgi:hypothetical protein
MWRYEGNIVELSMEFGVAFETPILQWVVDIPIYLVAKRLDLALAPRLAATPEAFRLRNSGSDCRIKADIC